MDVKSISVSCFVTFIDDHYGKDQAFALKSKDQVLHVFEHLHTSVERETCKLLKCVRVDNGGKYYGSFEHDFNEHDIKLEKIVSKTP